MLIAITGNKGAGKDTIGAVLKDQRFTEVKFAGALKAMLRQLYWTAGLAAHEIERKIEGDMKERPCAILGGKTPRHAMQTLGHEWREMIDSHLWTRVVQRQMMTSLAQGLPVVCTDLRYQREADVIRFLGGSIWRVTRPGVETNDAHVSETEMASIEADLEITNDGTLEELAAKAHEALQGMMA